MRGRVSCQTLLCNLCDGLSDGYDQDYIERELTDCLSVIPRMGGSADERLEVTLFYIAECLSVCTKLAVYDRPNNEPVPDFDTRTAVLRLEAVGWNNREIDRFLKRLWH